MKQIKEAATFSNNLVTNANSHLASLKSNGPKNHYAKWFGPYELIDSNIVKAHFDVITAKATLLTYDCSACKTQRHYGAMQAYTTPKKDRAKINLCGKFWTSPATASGNLRVGCCRLAHIAILAQQGPAAAEQRLHQSAAADFRQLQYYFG
ncbi:hypothetical protein RSOL_184540, partial [Rhizoctonia solani AG-3 Rhs1AP]